MTRRARRFVEQLLGGRSPSGFQADPEEAALIHTAVALKAAGSPAPEPSEEFKERLFEDLAAQQRVAAEASNVVSLQRRPRRTWLAAAAAAVALVAGTAAVTHAVTGQRAQSAIGHSAQVREVALLDASHHRVGELRLLSGHPSWVVMNVHVGSHTGPAKCELQDAHGHVLANGSFWLAGGSGAWAKTVAVNTDHIAGAHVITPSGTILASATFQVA
jgi:hypothetical protein